MEKVLPVCHCFSKHKLASVLKEGLAPQEIAIQSIIIDALSDFISQERHMDIKRSQSVHAFSPLWESMITAFCHTKEMDNEDDPVACFDVDETTPVYPGEAIMAAEVYLNQHDFKNLNKVLNNALDEVRPLKEVYHPKEVEQIWLEVLSPTIPPSKLRIYPNIKKAIQAESK